MVFPSIKRMDQSDLTRSNPILTSAAKGELCNCTLFSALTHQSPVFGDKKPGSSDLTVAGSCAPIWEPAVQVTGNDQNSAVDAPNGDNVPAGNNDAVATGGADAAGGANDTVMNEQLGLPIVKLRMKFFPFEHGGWGGHYAAHPAIMANPDVATVHQQNVVDTLVNAEEAPVAAQVSILWRTRKW
ncbi:hypothetical protein CNMCM5793_009009 [Aspergillus hiratsukae]|uniref:Uncharacterized protein n=1 Tax=Aspergillus hiratsukae TaxID=1194566 RepID=A0A8H6P7V9_9EURO|nr:hypothetical protein CNMCM5793_009009 [Aspergillus hiratsukae]